MTDEIRKQLVDWGGIMGMPPLNWVRFSIAPYELYFYEEGKVFFADNCDYQLAPWKTLEDIEKVLDVFGVKRKKWRASNHCVYCGGVHVACFFDPETGNSNPEAAREYAEWMNAKE